jgi:hypothetical protein
LETPPLHRPTLASAYPLLAGRLGFDEDRLRRVVGAFYRGSLHDLVSLEHAAARGDWAQVRRLAARIGIGCAQVGERNAGEGLAALLEPHCDTAARAIFLNVYEVRRAALLAAIERAGALSFGALR